MKQFLQVFNNAHIIYIGEGHSRKQTGTLGRI